MIVFSSQIIRVVVGECLGIGDEDGDGDEEADADGDVDLF